MQHEAIVGRSPPRVSSPRIRPTFMGFAVPDQPEPACLVIADISGYTSYLAGVENRAS